eukprot:COSAG06_NODE_6727_length_2808_cov_1.668882_2_plen_41_part_01
MQRAVCCCASSSSSHVVAVEEGVPEWYMCEFHCGFQGTLEA